MFSRLRVNTLMATNRPGSQSKRRCGYFENAMDLASLHHCASPCLKMRCVIRAHIKIRCETWPGKIIFPATNIWLPRVLSDFYFLTLWRTSIFYFYRPINTPV